MKNSLQLLLIFLLISTNIWSQEKCTNRSYRYAKKAEDYMNKPNPNYEKAEKKLAKCLYKYPECYACISASAKFSYKRKKPKRALYTVNYGLTFFPNDRGLNCQKFNILNMLYSEVNKERAYEEALSMIHQLESMNLEKIASCNFDKQWITNKKALLSTEFSWRYYYALEKKNLMVFHIKKALRQRDTTLGLILISELVSTNLVPLGSLGSEIKNWAFSQLLSIYLEQGDYFSARTTAQTLVVRDFEIIRNKKRICECDLKLAENAENAGEFELSLDYLEHFKRYCMQSVKDKYNRVCIKEANRLLTGGARKEDFLKALELVNQIDCSENQLSNDCNEVKTIQRNANLALSREFQKSNDWVKAIYYLNVILLDSPNDKEVLKERYKVSFKIGYSAYLDRDYDLALGMLLNAEKDDNGIESAYFIGKTYEKTFRFRLAEKYMRKVVDFSKSEGFIGFDNHARFDIARYLSMRGESEQAKSFLPDFCDADYHLFRDKAKIDPAFDSLRGDTQFKSWIAGHRRLKFSNFGILTSYNEDWMINSDPGPEYFIEVTLEDGTTYTSQQNKHYNYNSKWRYDLQWLDNFTFLTHYDKPHAEERFTLRVLEEDVNEALNYRKVDPVVELNLKLDKPCSKTEWKPSYRSMVFFLLYRYEFHVYFTVTDNYEQLEPKHVNKSLSRFRVPEPNYTPFFGMITCAAQWLFQSEYVFLAHIAKAIIIDRSFEKNEEGIQQALTSHAANKFLPEKIYNLIRDASFINCFLDLINELDDGQNQWKY